MWLMAVYHQVSMFSLKPADATSTGGRTLLVPTPFSIKMALLDVALRLMGEADGSMLFPLIRDLGIALSPPPQLVVNNCFMRILKPRRVKGGAVKDGDEGDESEGGSPGPFIRSVAFREYVQYNGPLGIALEVSTREEVDLLSPLFAQVTYFGKRGSLFQIDGPPITMQQLPVRQGYLPVNQSLKVELEQPPGVLQMLDDCGKSASFANISIYSRESLSIGKDRMLNLVTLPYRLTRGSRGFSLYERIA